MSETNVRQDNFALQVLTAKEAAGKLSPEQEKQLNQLRDRLNNSTSVTATPDSDSPPSKDPFAKKSLFTGPGRQSKSIVNKPSQGSTAANK